MKTNIIVAVKTTLKLLILAGLPVFLASAEKPDFRQTSPKTTLAEESVRITQDNKLPAEWTWNGKNFAIQPFLTGKNRMDKVKSFTTLGISELKTKADFIKINGYKFSSDCTSSDLTAAEASAIKYLNRSIELFDSKLKRALVKKDSFTIERTSKNKLYYSTEINEGPHPEGRTVACWQDENSVGFDGVTGYVDIPHFKKLEKENEYLITQYSTERKPEIMYHVFAYQEISIKTKVENMKEVLKEAAWDNLLPAESFPAIICKPEQSEMIVGKVFKLKAAMRRGLIDIYQYMEVQDSGVLAEREKALAMAEELKKEVKKNKADGTFGYKTEILFSDEHRVELEEKGLAEAIENAKLQAVTNAFQLGIPVKNITPLIDYKDPPETRPDQAGNIVFTTKVMLYY